MNKLKLFFKKLMKSDYTTVFSFDMIAKALVAIVTVLIVRMLTTEDYAIYTNFTEVAGLLLSIIGTGLSIPFVTYSAEQNSRGNNSGNVLFNTCCLLMVCVTLATLLLCPLIVGVYNLPIGLAILAVLYGGLQSQNKLAQSYFQSKQEFRRSGYVTNFKNVSLLLCILMVFVIFGKSTASAAAVVTLISALIAFVACVAWIWQENKSKSLEISVTLLKQLLSESKWLILYFIFQSFFSSICIVILNQRGTSIDVANFGVANKYYNLLLMFLTSLQTVLRVKTCQKEMVDSAQKRREFSVNWVKKVLPIVGCVVVIAELCSGIILPLLNGEGYELSINVFRILMIAVFFGYLFSPNTAILIAAKKHKLLLLLAVVSCIVGGSLCYLLLPIIGVNAAAISIVVSNLILNGTGFVIILRESD